MLSEIFHVSLLVLSADIFLELGSHLCRLNRKTDEEKRRLSTEIIGKDSPTRRHTSPTRRMFTYYPLSLFLSCTSFKHTH